jgi:hypothetical protein
MTKEEAFILWSDKHDLADGLPWELDSNVARTIFNAGWDARGEASKQTDMFPVATAEGQDVANLSATDGQITADEIYAAYPRKVGRAAAIKAIERAMKKVAPAILLQAVKDYAAAVKTWPPTARFTVVGTDTVPHTATWMNQERWTDDRSEWVKGAVKHSVSQFGRKYE